MLFPGWAGLKPLQFQRKPFSAYGMLLSWMLPAAAPVFELDSDRNPGILRPSRAASLSKQYNNLL